MDDSIDDLLMRRWRLFSSEVETLMRSTPHFLGEADPPEERGVYMFFDENATISYVGIAANLRDRLHKHVSGDESHAVQRAYKDRFPDRTLRRKFIEDKVRARWLSVSDPEKSADLERLIIWLFQPPWNQR